MILKKSFLQFCDKYTLFNEKDKILLAISGGIDSCVLAHLFYEIQSEKNFNQFYFALAHCNFNLRGEEAEKDALHIKNLAQKYGIAFFEVKFETKKYAEKHQISIQMAARDLRYEWFEKVRQENRFSYIATAHHQNDNLETALFNFTKGTGIAGLRGILPKVNNIIRPLLFAKREEIEMYAIDNQLVWREDASNKIDKYARNLIRNQVVPLLKKINPNIENTFETTAKKMQDLEAILKEQVAYFEEVNEQYYQKKLIENTQKKSIIDSIFGNYFVQNIALEVLKIKAGGQTILYELIKKYNFSYAQTQQLWANNIDNNSEDNLENVIQNVTISGKQYFSQTHIITQNRGDLIVEKNIKNNKNNKNNLQLLDNEIIIENIDNEKSFFYENEFFRLDFRTFEREELQTLKMPLDEIIVDFEKVVFPLKMRFWEDGDVFYPLGMNGKKKISDFLINQKVPLNSKKNVLLLFSDEKIIWVVGMRTDNRFKISAETKKILHIKIIGK